MLTLRAFMFERVYLGERRAGGARRARTRSCSEIFDHLVAERAGDALAARSTDYVAGMTDRFALAYAAGSD